MVLRRTACLPFLTPSSKKIPSRADAVTSRLTCVLLVSLLAVVPAVAQTPETDPKTAIDRLAAFDYPTRMNAARLLRRMTAADVVPPLEQAVRSHQDQFVRYRALVLLTAFNDRGTAGVMRSLLADRNDRVREVAYRWFELHPDPALTPTLLAALNTEQAEFVRPALIHALAALGVDAQVQRALVEETGRGLDFFRSAVIDALGEHRAAYALDAIMPVALLQGPLQDDAVIALGRIRDKRALATLKGLVNAPPDVVPAVYAARCLIEDGCAEAIANLNEIARRRGPALSTARASVAAIGVIAAQADVAATEALVVLGTAPGLGNDAAVAFGGLSVRNPDHVIAWLEGAAESTRTAAVALLRAGFEALEEDFAEEQFYAAARARYWSSPEGSVTRTVTAALIDKLDF
jgi:HEAT repeat protein